MKEKNEKIILFDGECSLCNKYVNLVIRNSRKNEFKFISMKSTKGAAKLKSINNELDLKQTIILIEKTSVKTKSDAIIAIISKLRFPYKLLIAIKIIPKFLLDKAYNIIALNRYKLFGKSNNCKIKKPNY